MAGKQDGFLSDIDLSALAQLWSMLNPETRLQQEMGQDAPNVRGGLGILEHAATGPVAGLKGLKSLKSLKKKWADDYGYPAPRIIRKPQKQKKVQFPEPIWDSKLERWVFRKGE